jgi:EAL domain-containing protein (putative c-di-GMP-specific phosphodiesterase class I)
VKMDLKAIDDGLTRGEFFLEYLPTISLGDGRCVGAEALARWRHPDGVIQPEEFIPLLENTPLSGRLTYWVIDTVAAELSGWLRAHPQVHLSINVPPEVLGRGGLAYAAEKSGLREFASQLVLEVTERGVPDLLGLQALIAIPDAGVRLALDDVSMSGANLAILTRSPFTFIKLDRALVQQITPQTPQPTWLQGIAALLQTTQLDVVAEGVETEFQATALRQCGISLAQGFRFARPTSAAGLIEFHARNGGGAC